MSLGGGTFVPSAFLTTAVAFVAIGLIVLYRAVVGPTTPDRVIAVNAIGTTTVVVIALVAGAFDQPGLLDIALVYAMLNFLLSLGVARFAIERGRIL